ncbi:MAG: hypothetical protein HOC24_15875 [Deltaproteobacteria bacterium]|nr:hypothetical protein [Deltaproteobacteria bacterium]
MKIQNCGFTRKQLRVNLTFGELTTETVNPDMIRKYLGGIGYLSGY